MCVTCEDLYVLSASGCQVACGNSQVDGDEECDDGNSVEDDECSECKVRVSASELTFMEASEQSVSQGQTVASAISSSSNALLLILTQLTQIGTLGPTFFILLHMQQLLRAISLIGHFNNTYIQQYLRIKMSPFDI